MPRAPQKRKLETRAKLEQVARMLADEGGFAALRVEDVVAQAGVAKGTLFSHFKDKDHLLAVLIGADMMDLLDSWEAGPAPQTIADLVDLLETHMSYVARDRVIFDILLRFSGSLGTEVDDRVAESFMRQVALLETWLGAMQATGCIRGDLSALLLAEGIQAFLNHVLAIGFCAQHCADETATQTLLPFLRGWLLPPAQTNG